MIVTIVSENEDGGIFLTKEEAVADWFIVVPFNQLIYIAPNGAVDKIDPSERQYFDSIDDAYRYIINKLV